MTNPTDPLFIREKSLKHAIYLHCLRFPKKGAVMTPAKTASTQKPPPFLHEYIGVFGPLRTLNECASKWNSWSYPERTPTNMMYRNHLLHLSHKKTLLLSIILVV